MYNIKEIVFISFICITYGHIGDIMTDNLIGYDCSLSTKHTEISLSPIVDCSIPKRNVTFSDVKIQIVQPKIVTELEYIQCSAIYRYEIVYCGKFGGRNTPLDRQVHVEKVNKYDCVEAHKTHIISPGFHRELTVTIENNVGRYSGVIIGNTDDKSCDGSVFHSPGGVRYNRVVVFLDYEIILKTGVGTVEPSNYNAKVVLSSGNTCLYEDTTCFDGINGRTYWIDKLSRSCETSGYEAIYEGVVSRIIDDDKQSPVISYLTKKADKQRFFIKQTSPVTICGMPGYRTQHPNVFVIERGNYDFNIKYNPSSLSPRSINLDTHLGMKLSYLQYDTGSQIDQLYLLLKGEICEINAKTVRNSLSLAKLDPKDFGYLYYGKPGFLGLVRGEVIYLKECVPQIVNIRLSENCYQDLPILYNNESYFLTPRSKLIVKEGHEIECSNLMPEKYFVEGTWYRKNRHGLDAAPSPTEISVRLNGNWSFQQDHEISSKGIYTREEIEKYQKMISEPISTMAKQISLIKSIDGDRDIWEGADVTNAIKPEDFENFRKKAYPTVWSRLRAGFLDFGGFSGAILGIYVAFKFFYSNSGRT
ncbi:putative glycoprotein [Hubei rhabdo-like virus 7]|uniref:Putative glycoprotein n=1 Tax=Hubei rhabdo-like virus 7 TaxID=1923191 RepID=A0A1L3KMW9_9MONO|nr:putative glycoprotein [Hubei rhabdo-like virus 7]APG78728.1 putative glycoprotein [Hubei rhabdo-like virus 7]